MDPIAFYTQQSRFTDPGEEHIRLYAGLPRDIASLCRIVQGLIIHYLDGEKLFGYAIPQERLQEVDTCYVQKMLTRIIELDSRPLTEVRPPEKRLVGCCRDFATLFCSMARYHSIPTRNRVGFGAYFNPSFNIDHEIIEYWNVETGSWQLVDPEMSDLHVNIYKIPFDTHNVPRDQFIVGGLAWQMCRSGQADPNKFGLDPETDIKGWWFIRNRLIHDLAAQNKTELLLWHTWGLMDMYATPTEEELAVLDKVATLTQGGNESFQEVLQIYSSHPSLRVPRVVMSHSPAAEPREVTLAI